MVTSIVHHLVMMRSGDHALVPLALSVAHARATSGTRHPARSKFWSCRHGTHRSAPPTWSSRGERGSAQQGVWPCLGSWHAHHGSASSPEHLPVIPSEARDLSPSAQVSALSRQDVTYVCLMADGW